MSATQIDNAKLEAFMGQVVSDMGAMISAPLMVIGEKLGLYKAMAGAGSLSSAELAERTGVAERSRAGVAAKPGGRRLHRLRRRDGHLLAARRAGARSRRRGKPGLHPRSVRADRVALRRRGRRSPRRSARDGHGLARARSPALLRHRAVLPARLQGATSLPNGCRRSTASSRSSSAGARSPTSAAATVPPRSSWPRRSRTRVLRLRLPRRLDRAGAQAGRGGGCR